MLVLVARVEAYLQGVLINVLTDAAVMAGHSNVTVLEVVAAHVGYTAPLESLENLSTIRFQHGAIPAAVDGLY